MKRISFGQLPAYAQRAAAVLGADTVIVKGDGRAPAQTWRQRRRAPGRSRRVEGSRKNLHGVDRQHADTYRDWLLSDVEELSTVRHDEWPEVFRKFNRVSEDAGVPLPSRRDRQRENWGWWTDALRKQLENASVEQIMWYAAQAYYVMDGQCDVCEARS